ncbi:MAG: DUF3924 family protein [Candidatus Helarchaeota archaeon]
MTGTTIQLNKKTKEELFHLKNRIEKRLGRSISYNDLIKLLLKNNKNAIIKQNLREFQKFKGILSKKTQKILRNERKIDLRKEEYEQK